MLRQMLQEAINATPNATRGHIALFVLQLFFLLLSSIRFIHSDIREKIHSNQDFYEYNIHAKNNIQMSKFLVLFLKLCKNTSLIN